jgi:hypothetical protein
MRASELDFIRVLAGALLAAALLAWAALELRHRRRRARLARERREAQARVKVLEEAWREGYRTGRTDALVAAANEAHALNEEGVT